MSGRLEHRRRVGAMTLAALAALAFLVATAPRKAASRPSARADAPLGLQTGPVPWAPEYTFLRRRVAALRLPGQSDTVFHIHAHLRIFVNGRRVPVPAQIGIDPHGRFLAPLHTHDASGIVHVESDRPFPFTLGQFFAIWGIRFTDTRIGGYTDRDDRRLRVYVNGRHVAHPVGRVLRAHDRIVVGYGRPGSLPTVDRTPFPAGL
jgi:hypothetical protein